MDVKLELSNNLKAKPEWGKDKLGFGKILTDHMLLVDYNPSEGWHGARVVPYAPLQLDPAAGCLHYGQLIFEGMKAYKGEDGKIALFRPRENMKRLNESGWRMCIPPIDEEYLLNALIKFIEVEKDWVPTVAGSSLYIRPFILSTEAFLGVKPSDTYQLCIILSPVDSYYSGGLAPVNIYVEEKYVRASKGGTGYAKCAGNYAASMRSQLEAQAKGFAQVLWLDGIERKYVEEVGAMNTFFVIDGVAVTPELTGSILPGITRKSVIEILRGWGIPVEERLLSIDELAETHKNGKLQEAFGTGTAATIAPIGSLTWGGDTMQISEGKIGEITQRLYDEVLGIQFAKCADSRGWRKVIIE